MSDTFVSRVGERYFGGGGRTNTGRSLSEIEAALAGGDEDKKFVPGLPKYPRGFSPTQAARISDYGGGPTSGGMGPRVGGIPRYYDGDEMRPADLPPHNIAALQKLLVDANLLSDPRWGYWDDKSRDAYQTALREANQQGVDIQTMLTTYAEAGAAAEAEARAPYVAPTLELRTTNKDDLTKVFRDATTRLTGIGWTDRQIAELVDAYGWQEIKLQVDAYNQTTAREREVYETGTTDNPAVINTPSMADPSTYIEKEIKRRDPGGYQAAQIGEEGGFLDAFLGALGGYAGGG